MKNLLPVMAKPESVSASKAPKITRKHTLFQSFFRLIQPFLLLVAAHLYLIELTVGLLRQSPSPRLVIVSSLLLRSGRLDLTGVRELCGSSRRRNPPEYANSKLMNALTAREIQKR